MTTQTSLSQSDLDPTQEQKEQIQADVLAQNAARCAEGLPERDVPSYVELRYDRHCAKAYQVLLSPYLKAALAESLPADGSGMSPEDYRTSVAKAQAQLRDITGIVPPVLKAKTSIKSLREHSHSFMKRSSH